MIWARTIRHGHGENRHPADREFHIQGSDHRRFRGRRERRSVCQLQGKQDPLLTPHTAIISRVSVVTNR